MKVGNKDITVFGRSINDLAADIAAIHTTPDALRSASVYLNWEEEGALDQIAGMMWPALLGLSLRERYGAHGVDVPGIGAQITFPGNEVELTFQLG